MLGFHSATRAAPRTRRSGFTLMELMAVVGILVLMASMVVGGFAGIQRAMGTSTGADRFRRALGAARQQACVDGTDVFVWCIGMDKFVVCRKGGTVSGLPTRKDKRSDVSYASEEAVEAWWVCDEFAEGGSDVSEAYINSDDLGSSGARTEIGRLRLPGGNEVTVKGADLSKFFRREFSERMVFDVTAGKIATCAYPPFHLTTPDFEGWMFGIRDSDYERGTFTIGHEYAWPLMPVQTLPGGFVFDGSWKASDGELDENWVQRAYVHFYPDGRAECGIPSGFTITEAGVAKPMVQKVKVDRNGLVTVTSK